MTNHYVVQETKRQMLNEINNFLIWCQYHMNVLKDNHVEESEYDYVYQTLSELSDDHPNLTTISFVAKRQPKTKLSEFNIDRTNRDGLKLGTTCLGRRNRIEEIKSYFKEN